jgi:putative Holliday junction resolvase
MRILGVDFGRKRVGLALSDPTATLARPWRVLEGAETPLQSASSLASLLEQWRTGEDPDAGDVRAVVVGLPRRLNGSDNDQTQPARQFADDLARLTGLQVYLQDERLSSREAEERLALRERDWRVRKEKLDAAAAAVILQDFLDAPRRQSPAAPSGAFD